MKIDRVNNIYEKYLDNTIKTKNDKDLQKSITKDDVVNIQISDTAKALVKTISQAEDATFSKKVEGIRQSILSGSYKISPEEIVDKILETLEFQRGSEI
ncbi:MAG: flagellar biosynthesis anti-sigma factor FlgM [Tissierella sp.]|nr:flagellar biosynthesis anti-sigma factor FlgM [Tissierella sp.]